MDPFSYLSVLISIILALGMTRVLAGVGEMLQARSRRQLYWLHAVWVVNLFLYLVVAWWIFYRRRNQQPWTFFLFIFVLIDPPSWTWPLSFFFRPSLLWMTSSITKRTITPTIAYSSFSSQYSRRSISSIPVKGHFASSRIGTALLHQQHPLFRRTSDRRDYAE